MSWQQWSDKSWKSNAAGDIELNTVIDQIDRRLELSEEHYAYSSCLRGWCGSMPSGLAINEELE